MSDDPLIGQQVGNYVIRTVLGSGGMGAVYRALHPDIGREVAVKVLAHHLSLLPHLGERFLAEARALARIEHPNVIQIFDYGKLPDGRLFYIMELLKGQELARIMTEAGPMPARMVLPYVEQICAGLKATHDQGIIHRDLKPENIFVLDREPLALKIIDYGIARVQASGPAPVTLTQTGMVLGTPLYIAPEQAAGETHRIGPHTDLYSLGVVLYTMLAGRPPFFHPNPAVLMAQHITSPLPPLREAQPDVPVAVASLVERCLRKQPEGRPATARQVAVEFAQALVLPDRDAGLTRPEEGLAAPTTLDEAPPVMTRALGSPPPPEPFVPGRSQAVAVRRVGVPASDSQAPGPGPALSDGPSQRSESSPKSPGSSSTASPIAASDPGFVPALPAASGPLPSQATGLTGLGAWEAGATEGPGPARGRRWIVLGLAILGLVAFCLLLLRVNLHSLDERGSRIEAPTRPTSTGATLGTGPAPDADAADLLVRGSPGSEADAGLAPVKDRPRRSDRVQPRLTEKGASDGSRTTRPPGSELQDPLRAKPMVPAPASPEGRGPGPDKPPAPPVRRIGEGTMEF